MKELIPHERPPSGDEFEKSKTQNEIKNKNPSIKESDVILQKLLYTII